MKMLEVFSYEACADFAEYLAYCWIDQTVKKFIEDILGKSDAASELSSVAIKKLKRFRNPRSIEKVAKGFKQYLETLLSEIEECKADSKEIKDGDTFVLELTNSCEQFKNYIAQNYNL